MSEADEASLVRECLKGNTGAYDALLERYQRPIFNAALRMVNDYHDAQDITQNAFLKAFQNLGKFDFKHKFYSWIYRIAIHESINLLQRKSRFEPTEGKKELASGISPEAAMQGVEMSAHLQQALMGIKTDQRTVIVLRHFLGCSYRDMGEILEIPEKTVKSRLFTARQQLKSVLLRQGVLSI